MAEIDFAFQRVGVPRFKDAEIERLRALVEKMTQQTTHLRDLLGQAADALEEEFGSPSDPDYGIKGPVHDLIAELRQAAE